ncbi:PPE domain-containing protein [Mycobacterium sp.]
MVLPPEINSLLMFSGAGSGPLLEACDLALKSFEFG